MSYTVFQPFAAGLGIIRTVSLMEILLTVLKIFHAIVSQII